ncbi:Uncharacterised protein [uncultured Ruminococcus sp.]|nr:Uncharacterised protein [uncultured Ruminococcus sp.]
MQYLAQEKLVVATPIAAAFAVGAQVGNRAVVKHTLHLGGQAGFNPLGMSVPLFCGGMLHVPHGGPVLDAFNPAVRLQPCIFQVVERVGEGLVEVRGGRIQPPMLTQPAIVGLDPQDLRRRVRLSELTGPLAAAGKAGCEAELVPRGVRDGVGAAARAAVRAAVCAASGNGFRQGLHTKIRVRGDGGEQRHGPMGQENSTSVQLRAAFLAINLIPSHGDVGGVVHKGNFAAAEFQPKARFAFTGDAQYGAALPCVRGASGHERVELGGQRAAVRQDSAADQAAWHVVCGGLRSAGFPGKPCGRLIAHADDKLCQHHMLRPAVNNIIVGHQCHVGVGLAHKHHALAPGARPLILVFQRGLRFGQGSPLIHNKHLSICLRAIPIAGFAGLPGTQKIGFIIAWICG